MNASWLVTPYFFDEYDAALRRAVSPGVPFINNDPGNVVGRSAASLARVHRPIAEFVVSAVKRNELPISIAGDCCASLPVMAGLQQAGLDPALVWLDAHGDFNTIETSPSGFLGGMPLAMMVGRGDLSIPDQSGQSPVSEEDVWLIDARDLDPLEEMALQESRVHRRALAALDGLTFDRPVHLHIDNDIVNAMEVPANNYPVVGGPSLVDTIKQCSTFTSRNSICAISLSGWSGRLDHDDRTSRACRSLLSYIVNASL